MGATALRAIDGFRLVREVAPPGTDVQIAPRSAVLRDGRPTGLTLRGAVLEAQFAVHTDSYLLLVTDDCPYEEELHVYLLDRNCTMVEQLDCGYPYTPGILRHVRITGKNALQFSFIDGWRHRLLVHDPPRYLWNGGAGVGEVLRCLRRRRLKITAEPFRLHSTT